VLILEAPTGGWKEGVQALVAELLTSGYELTVRAGRAHSPDQLRQELELEVARSGVWAGVSLTRADGRASAWLCRGVGSCERLEMEVAEGELSRSRLAVAVVERLRPLELPARAAPPKVPHPPAAPTAGAGGPVEHPRQPRARSLRAWVSGGGVLSSGVAAPLPWVGASLGAMLSAPWGLEVGLAGSPLAGTAQTAAGSLSLRALQGIAFATFEPFPQSRFGLSLGLGGGTLHLRESATPAPGFAGLSQSATVAVVSARARVQYHRGRLYLGLTVDPGVLVPALKVEAGSATVLRIGRPWVALQASLGVAL
jgi:hypothetical protein